MTVMMQEMTWQEFEGKRKDSVVILPVGSTEQHGPVLPLSVDAIIATELGKTVAKKIGGIVAPTINYGYKATPLSGSSPRYKGTINLSGATLISLISDILEELIRDGVSKIFVLNAHFENEAFILEAMDIVSKKYPEITMVESAWWNQVSETTIDVVFDEVDFPGWSLEHAAIAETSMTMHFAPDLVKMENYIEGGVEKEATYNIFPISKCEVPSTGLVHTARSSSKEKGALLVEDVIKNYIEVLKETFK